MAPIISGDTEGVDEATLGGTGRGGLLSDGYLREAPLASHLDEGERPVMVRANGKKGVLRSEVGSDERERTAPGEGYRAFALATDTRLRFLVGDSDGGDWSTSVPLADVEVVEHSDGVLAGEFVVTTTADVEWYFPSRSELGPMVEYLDAASLSWIAIEERLDDARAAVAEADRLTGARRYDDAMAAVRDAMGETDAARRAERELHGDGVAAATERIERAEERIREARLAVLEGRAAHAIDRAEAAWRDGEYERAHDAYGRAHGDYEEALAAVDEAAAERLRTKLDRVERNVAALERAPVESAEQARERADETDDRRERADRLEFALERYRTALTLDWGRSTRRFEGDTERIRDAVDTVAGQLVETRREYAARRIRAGDDHREEGRTARAAACYRDAHDALADTIPTARELVPEALDALTDRRDAVADRLRRLDTGDDWTPVPSGSH
ncbi:hypothetical protein [Halosimplex halophilum]|uniref:hypothetical protein n=1 Tax=Halosimplex halophilum TaxID=2559572 RepID=UPI00107EFDD5|nr:hypothetical protein [Halosimplex halophilum]